MIRAKKSFERCAPADMVARFHNADNQWQMRTKAGAIALAAKLSQLERKRKTKAAEGRGERASARNEALSGAEYLCVHAA